MLERALSPRRMICGVSSIDDFASPSATRLKEEETSSHGVNTRVVFSSSIRRDLLGEETQKENQARDVWLSIQNFPEG